MTAHLVRGDALALPLPDASVDLVVTSPPYFGLRSYQDGGEHYPGQIGAEPTPAEFVEALLAATREMVRVLKPSGSIWINLGDKYNAYNGNRGDGSIQTNSARQRVAGGSGLDVDGIQAKSLIGLPWRYALRCIDDLQLVLRAEVIWSKPNGMPESVTDRVRRSHETWFHFVKQRRYFSAVDEIRDDYAPGAVANRSMASRNRSPRHLAALDTTGWKDRVSTVDGHPLGKLPSSVWTIPTQPLSVPAGFEDHYAAFPMEWPRRIIRGWSPTGICTACGEGRRPVVDRPGLLGGDNNQFSRDGSRARSEMDGGSKQWAARMAEPDRLVGYSCACPDTSAPTSPAVVLDPFSGTGTVALVADVLGRTGVGVELSADYCRLARWRTTDSGERARALEVPKPEVVPDDQGSLF